MSTPTRTRASPAVAGSNAPHTLASTPLERPGNGFLDTEDREVHTKTTTHSAVMLQDARTTPARGGLTTIRRPKLNSWEKQLTENPEVRRKATIAQLCMQTLFHPVFQPHLTLATDFFDYYFSALSYLASRKERRAKFDADTSSRSLPLTGEAYAKELKSYLGRERVLLRKRRTKTKVHQFHIIAQIGQGGYGEVFLARKRDSGEVCALKKMRKGTLIKMDEARHVLIERDILTATKSPWLVSLLYAFQDPEFVYLAMEYVPGGDFRTLLNNSGVLKEHHARFYIAEMFAAVNELHRLGYIHRDLKPEACFAIIK